MHLPVAEGALGGHVLGDATYAACSVDDDLVALVIFAVFEKVASVNEDAEVAIRSAILPIHRDGTANLLVC